MALKVSLLKSVDAKHNDILNDAQLDYHGRRMATCSSDCSINIYDVSKDENSFITKLNGHDGPVWQVAWSDPSLGNYLASCSYDKKVIIWKETNSRWEKDYVHVTHLSSTTSISWAPSEHGLILASSSLDGSVSIISQNAEYKWESDTILDVDRVGCMCVCWGPPFKYTNQDRPESVKQIAVAGLEGLIKIYRYSNNKWNEAEILNGDQDSVRSIAWSAHSYGLVNIIASCYQNGAVLIWSRKDNTDQLWESHLLKKFQETVWHVSWSEVGNLLAISSGEHNVSLWRSTLDGEWLCLSELPDNLQ